MLGDLVCGFVADGYLLDEFRAAVNRTALGGSAILPFEVAVVASAASQPDSLVNNCDGRDETEMSNVRGETGDAFADLVQI